jgi:DNA-binding NarL/FixJ family response regulator
MINLKHKNNNLTKSEIEILKLIADGNSNREIAKIRNRKLCTVKQQRWIVMKKLGLKNAAQVTSFVIKNMKETDK